MVQKRSLPSSLPKNWPHSTTHDVELKPKRLINIGTYQDYSFCNNSIKTSKYELWNFLGKFLLEEFNPKTKIANCYFLLIASMQCIPQISNTNGYPTTLIPLTVVLLVSGLFKIMEDVARHRADKKANSSKTEIYSYKEEDFQPILWSDVQVGDFIRIHSREVVPADILILQVHEESSIIKPLTTTELLHSHTPTTQHDSKLSSTHKYLINSNSQSSALFHSKNTDKFDTHQFAPIIQRSGGNNLKGVEEGASDDQSTGPKLRGTC
jgi:magnesium-transporting ATPase (P-type)